MARAAARTMVFLPITLRTPPIGGNELRCFLADWGAAGTVTMRSNASPRMSSPGGSQQCCQRDCPGAYARAAGLTGPVPFVLRHVTDAPGSARLRSGDTMFQLRRLALSAAAALALAATPAAAATPQDTLVMAFQMSIWSRSIRRRR